MAKIVAAAIKCPDGIFTGPTHGCIADDNPCAAGSGKFFINGFIDDNGKFYTRKEAGNGIGKESAIHEDVGRELDFK